MRRGGRRGRAGARFQERYLAAFGDGDRDAALDALHWLDHPDLPGPSGAPAPDVELDRLRTELYRPGSGAAAGRYADALDADRERRTRAGAARAVAAEPLRRRSRRTLVGGVVALGVVVIAAGIVIGTRTPATPPASPSALSAPAAVTADPVPHALVGTAADAAALRHAIEAGRGDATALVTRTAYAAVPVLSRTSRAAGNEAVEHGPATLQLDGLDDLDAHRSVTVITVCTAPMRSRWTLTAVRWRDGRPFGPEAVVARGPGGDCFPGLAAATVAAPDGWHPRTVRFQAPEGARYLLSVQVTA